MSNSFKALIINLTLGLAPCLCYGWTDPLVLSSNRSYDPSVSINQTGKAAVTWITHIDENLTIQASLLDKSWDDPIIIYAEGRNINPRIRIDDNSNVLVYWESIDSKSRKLMVRQNHGLKGWAEPFLLSSNLSSDSPAFISNSKGQIVLGWVTTENSIEIVRSTINSELIPATFFESDKGAKRDLRLRLDSIGNIVAIWVNTDTDQLMCSQTTDGFESEWTDPLALCSISDYLSLSITTNSFGNILVSWIDCKDNGIQTLMRLDKVWQKAPDNHSIGTYSIRTGVMDNSFILSWLNADTAIIQCVKFTDNSWGPTIDISDPLALDPYSLTISDAGNAQFSWTNGLSGEIYFAQLFSDDTVSKQVSLSNSDLSRNPKTASSVVGTIAVWENYIEADQSIQVSIDTAG